MVIVIVNVYLHIIIIIIITISVNIITSAYLSRSVDQHPFFPSMEVAPA